MKISVNDKELLTLSDIQQKVICNDINSDEFDADMGRRIHYIMMHKYEQCFKRLREEWDTKLVSNGVKMVPTDPDEYAKLVFSQSDYRDRKDREMHKDL